MCLGAWGRGWAAVMGAMFLAGGVALLGDLQGWWAVDFAVVGPALLVVVGAAFLAAALTGRGGAMVDRMRREAEDDDGDREGARMGRYWMVVMGAFFVLMAGGMLARSAGLLDRSLWSYAGPFFLLAVAGMFILRALQARDGAPGEGPAQAPPGPR